MTIPRTAPTGSDHTPADVEANHPAEKAGAPATATGRNGGTGEVPSLSALPPGAREGAVPLTITVYGTPAPQGSKRHMGNGVMIESSKKVKPWREAVKAAAIDAMYLHDCSNELAGYRNPITAPVVFVATFTFARPKNHFGTGKNSLRLKESAPKYPAGYPDSSKVIRATEDALTDAGVWRDDAQVVHHDVWKVYPGGHPDALPRPGAVIRVWQVAS